MLNPKMSDISEKKVYSMISLAAKAGKIVSGQFQTEKLIKAERAFLVIVAEDASDNTKKHFNDMCAYRQIPIVFFGEKEKLAKHIGKTLRASAAVTDAGLADSIKEKVTVTKHD